MIQGAMLKNAIISGSNNIAKYRKQVNDLNIFPVPDGDTGSNMSMTIGAAADALKQLPETATAAETAKAAASAMLRGARGNSGVILSLLFRAGRLWTMERSRQPRSGTRYVWARPRPWRRPLSCCRCSSAPVW